MQKIVWKGTNHAIFDLFRSGRARAQPRSLHRFVSLIFPHFFFFSLKLFLWKFWGFYRFVIWECWWKEWGSGVVDLWYWRPGADPEGGVGCISENPEIGDYMVKCVIHFLTPIFYYIANYTPNFFLNHNHFVIQWLIVSN